jgi:hypothetical protein
MSKSTTYFANFDAAPFESHENVDSTHLTSDPCYIQARNDDNAKKLKFVTTNHIDLIEAKDKLNFFSVGIQDTLFTPSSAKIDEYSSLVNGNKGGSLTNLKEKRGIELGQLPVPTMPYRGQLFHGDVDIEDTMRNELQVKKNACLPRESDFYNRSFTIFDEKLNIETPKPIKSVEKPEDGFALGRVGVASRFVKRFK